MIYRFPISTLSRICLSAICFLSSAHTLANSYNFSNTRSPSLRDDSPTLYGLNIYQAKHQTSASEIHKGKTDRAQNKTSLSKFYNAIDTLETEMGPFNPALSQALNQLGETLQKQGQHSEAIRIFRRAIHVDRVNQGLDTLKQIPAIKRIISSYLALNNFSKSDDAYEYLYFIENQNNQRDEAELLDSQKLYARWQRTAYLLERHDNQHRRLLRLYELHAKNVQALESKDLTNDVLVAHYYQQLDTLYLLDQHPGIEPLPLSLNAEEERRMALESREKTRLRQLNRNPYSQGLKILNKIAAIVENKEPAQKQRLALANGDWHTWFGRSYKAKSEYEKMALASEISSSEPQALPLSPQAWPEQFNKPDTRQGRVSLALNINKQGEVKHMEVIALHAKQGKVSTLAVKRLVRQLKFRPKLKQGISVDSLVVREYNFRY